MNINSEHSLVLKLIKDEGRTCGIIEENSQFLFLTKLLGPVNVTVRNYVLRSCLLTCFFNNHLYTITVDTLVPNY